MNRNGLEVWIITADYAFGYVVIPDDIEWESKISKGWSAIVTGIGKTESVNLCIDLTISNETGDWSVMKAIDGKAAVLTVKDGKTINCTTVFVGTGGHRVAPGFQNTVYYGEL